MQKNIIEELLKNIKDKTKALAIMRYLNRLNTEEQQELLKKLREFKFDEFYLDIVITNIKRGTCAEIIAFLELAHEMGLKEKNPRLCFDEDLLNCRNTATHMQLLRKLKDYDMHPFVCAVILDLNVLEHRTTDEQLRLLDKLKDCEYHGYAYEIVKSLAVLHNRSINEQLKMMEILKAESYNDSVYTLLTNMYIFGDSSFEEQVKLIEKLKEKDYEDAEMKIVLLFIERYKSRTIMDIIALIDKLRACEYHPLAVNVATDHNVLVCRNATEQLALLSKLQQSIWDEYVYQVICFIPLLKYDTFETQIETIDYLNRTNSKDLVISSLCNQYRAEFYEMKAREGEITPQEINTSNTITLATAISIYGTEVALELLSAMPDDIDPYSKIIDETKLTRRRTDEQ